MKYIKSIRIKNFRSIIDDTIDLSDYNCFVGKNDAGKSNVLKALNLFFNNKSDFDDSFFDFEKDFCKFAKKNKKAKEIEISLDICIPDSFKDAGLKTWTKKWRKNGLFFDNIGDMGGEKSRTRAFLSKIQYKYVPAFKSSDYFRLLLTDIYSSLTISTGASLSEQNDQYSQVLQNLTRDMSQKLEDKIGLKSLIRMPEDMSILFKDLSFSTSDSSVSGVNLNQRGDGIKARHIPSILASIQDNLKSSKTKYEVNYSFIWGFEEPENGLEFTACIEMADEFLEYNENCQILITTHSPVFYNSCNKQSNACLYYVSKSSGESKYKKSSDLNEIDSEVGMLPIIAPYIQDVQKKYEQISKEADLLRKKYETAKNKIIIAAEGKTDIIHIQNAFKRLKLNTNNLEFIDKDRLGGDSSLDQLLEKLSEVPRENKVVGIFDRDSDKYTAKYTNLTSMGNNVFGFCIPLVNEKNYGNKISIEHYYDEHTLKALVNGRRIFLGSEFYPSGNSKDGKYSTKCSIQNKISVNGVIDEKVYERDDLEQKNSIALSKNDFAEAICKNIIPNVDFSKFHQIYDKIQEISKM